MTKSSKCKAFAILALIAKAPRSHTELMQLTGQQNQAISDTLRRAMAAGLIFQYGERRTTEGSGRAEKLYRMSLETNDNAPAPPKRPARPRRQRDDFPMVQARRQAGEWERRTPLGRFLAPATPFDWLIA